MADSLIKEHVTPHSEDKKVSEPSDIEEKRESLAILATVGTTKEWIGENFFLEDVSRLSDKDVEKYFLRYQSVL